MARDFSKSLYNSVAWNKVRLSVLMRDSYLCRHCGRPAEEVHHIIHLSPSNIGDVSVTLNPDNLISLCKDCHFKAHEGEHGNGRIAKEHDESWQYEFDANGMLVLKAE